MQVRSERRRICGVGKIEAIRARTTAQTFHVALGVGNLLYICTEYIGDSHDLSLRPG